MPATFFQKIIIYTGIHTSNSQPTFRGVASSERTIIDQLKRTSFDNFGFTDLTTHFKQKTLTQLVVHRLFGSNIFHTNRFSDSCKKQDSYGEKREATREKQDASREK